MPYPFEYGREVSDRKALEESVPNGVELVYDVKPWRTFDVALEVDRKQKKVWVVVYSARYPQNFDAAITSLQETLAYAFNGSTRERVCIVHDLHRPEFYFNRDKGLMPRCRSCFDCQVYTDHFGFPHGVNCDECGNDGGEDTPGHRDPRGNYTLCLGDYSKHYEYPQCNKCTGIGMNLKRCGRCKMVFYCSQVCQKSDWAEHKKSCAPPQDGYIPRPLYPARPRPPMTD